MNAQIVVILVLDALVVMNQQRNCAPSVTVLTCGVEAGGRKCREPDEDGQVTINLIFIIIKQERSK